MKYFKDLGAVQLVFTMMNTDKNIEMVKKWADPDLRKAVGIWCIINAIIGSIGNFLTVLAIPYAANRNKYDQKPI